MLVLPLSALAEADKKGGKDHPVFSRMPGTYIAQYRQTEFDAFTFQLPNRGQERVEGKMTIIQYDTNKGGTKASALETVRQHQAALAAIGGETMFDNKTHITTLRLIKDGKEVWAKVDAIVGRYTLTIVERKAMVQAITAQAIFDELSQKGFMVIDVHFDTAQAVIKPESSPLIDQVAEMLQKNAGLKVSVEGHTDNVGNAKANQELSQARAKAVVTALTAKGIDASRLQAQGWGDQKPVADNTSDAGRAKNRRVELRKI
jgi:outer membrane protein OmpA-like peptidoglycan-associated protein